MNKDVEDGIKTPADLKQLVGNLGTFINQKMGLFIPRIWDNYGELKDLKQLFLMQLQTS